MSSTASGRQANLPILRDANRLLVENCGEADVQQLAQWPHHSGIRQRALRPLHWPGTSNAKQTNEWQNLNTGVRQ